MTAAIGPRGVSSWLPESSVPKPKSIGRRQSVRARCDSFRSHRHHRGCWEGEAECWQDDYADQFFCEGCNTWVVTWSLEDHLRDGGDTEPERLQGDEGLWPPQSATDRGEVA